MTTFRRISLCIKIWYNRNIRYNERFEFVFNFLDEIYKYTFGALGKLKWHVAYRTYERYHIVNTGLAPGYRDKDVIMLHAAFEILREFVEVECAHMEIIFSERRKYWLYCNLPRPFNKIFKPNQKERTRLGVKYIKRYEGMLDEFISDNIDKIDDEYVKKETEWYNDAIKNSNEIIDLYIWWTVGRPNRPNPFDVYPRTSEEDYDFFDFERCGETSWGEPLYKLNDPRSEEDKNSDSERYKLINELEEKYHQEDEEMFHRLIKVRRTLWT